jgi:PhzF family phenazine biosynthesis protein
MTENGTLHRMTAFSDTPAGGNPAGVWVGDALPAAGRMQALAAEVGYSETAFVAPAAGMAREVRYFSPAREVTFCGHATIAAGAVLGCGDEPATYRLSTRAGIVPVTVRLADDNYQVSLTSVATRHTGVPEAALDEFLRTLGWSRADLDTTIQPAFAYAGAWHLVLAAAEGERLASLAYDFERLREQMSEAGLTTLQLVWREHDTLFHSRNPFPVGGVVEDPATGAAAAALGGYLRDAALIEPPVVFEVRQGYAMGRPSRLTVAVPPEGGVEVSGTAVAIE